MTEASLTWEEGRLKFAGPVTIGAVTQLLKQVDSVIASAPAGEIVLDCEGMTLSDSAAIALLVEIHRKASRRKTALRIEGVREQLVSLINIYGVEWILGDTTISAPL